MPPSQTRCSVESLSPPLITHVREIHAHKNQCHTREQDDLSLIGSTFHEPIQAHGSGRLRTSAFSHGTFSSCYSVGFNQLERASFSINPRSGRSKGRKRKRFSHPSFPPRTLFHMQGDDD